MSKFRDVIIVHNRLLGGTSQIANVHIDTAMFSTHRWPRAHGRVASLPVDRGLQGVDLCDAFARRLDEIFGTGWKRGDILRGERSVKVVDNYFS